MLMMMMMELMLRYFVMVTVMIAFFRITFFFFIWIYYKSSTESWCNQFIAVNCFTNRISLKRISSYWTDFFKTHRIIIFALYNFWRIFEFFIFISIKMVCCCIRNLSLEKSKFNGLFWFNSLNFLNKLQRNGIISLNLSKIFK